MNAWPWQSRGIAATIAAIEGGARRIVFTGPTGSGKSFSIAQLLEWGKQTNRRGMLLTNRQMLFSQIKTSLESHGIWPGLRASGYDVALLRDIQLGMTQTEHLHCIRHKTRALHDCRLLLVDEIHTQKGEQMRELIAAYEAMGAVCVFFTATPLDLGDLGEELIVAGTMSECIAHGALVPARHYGCDEPDLSEIRKYQIGEDVSEADNHKAIMRPGVFGRVLAHYKQLNPNGDPTILFGPDVPGSLWFAEQFVKAGIPAAHIDGERCWINGEEYLTSQEIRDQIRDDCKSGALRAVCNRYVMREGVDWPFLTHGILACIMGSLTTYLQSAGRLLRAYPGKGMATIQDHGGAWHRHGSVNADRDWNLGDTSAKLSSQHAERMREGKEPQPIVCPKCSKVRIKGRECPFCGFASNRNARVVVQTNGELREVEGAIYKPRKESLKSDTLKKWEACFWRTRKSGGTLKQARGLFFRENNYWPPHDLPFMPKNGDDWCRKIQSVPFTDLYPGEKKQPQPAKVDPQGSLI